MKLPKRKHVSGSPPATTIMFLSLFLFFLSMIVSILIVNKGIKPVLLNYAEVRIEQIANQAMGIAVNNKISEDLETEDLLEVRVDENGKVVNYVFNAVVENRVQRNVQYRVENFLKMLEQGTRPEIGIPVEQDLELNESEKEALEDIREHGLLTEIPLGQTLGIPLLGNLGPKVPVHMEVIGHVATEITSSLVETGVNGAFIHVNVHIEVEIRVVMPFASKPVNVKQDIPVTKVYHPGEVPYYFNQNKEEAPNLSLPIDPTLDP